nr:HAD-IIA family hydrolase [Sneathiella limimaris]
MDGEQAFTLYEAVKDRLPFASHPTNSERHSGLLDVAPSVDAFVFDAFGVLNVGTTPIPGASDCIQELRRLGKKVFVLTNAASFNRNETFEKFNKLGFDFTHDELVTSRNAAELDLASFGPEHCWGVAATDTFRIEDLACQSLEITDDPETYENVSAFLFLSVQNWTEARQALLEKSLSQNPRPVVIANPDIVAPRGEYFSVEPGYFGHRMDRHYGIDVHFHGKPFPSVYDLVEERLQGSQIEPGRICMVGDTLHTDVLGGAARGWKTALVTDHGLFKGLDPELYIDKSGIRPDWMVGSI